MPPLVASRLPRWTLRPVDPTAMEALMGTQRISRVAAALLVARGITDPAAAAAHLEPRLSRLHDPFLLPDMKRATQRIARAIEQGETILVHGDYDVDGVTGTVLLMRLFELVGAKACWHIPNRFTDGYSFGPHSIEKAKACGATLVISVDNGTAAKETIAQLRDLGVDTIVTDHHEPPAGELPPAVAIVNPKLPGHAYPFRELCGGGVAFKLAWGVCQELTGATKVSEELRQFLFDAMGCVAIATVCDVVPLIDENRILAHFGLRSLEDSKVPGIVALLEVAGLKGRKLLAEDVAFQVGPRINASGRLGSAHTAVEVLLARDAASARTLAMALDTLNDERRRIEKALLSEVIAAAEVFADREQHPVLVVAGQGWHQGVLGILASRLVSRFERPAIVIGLDGERGRGSARSVPGFSVLDVMNGAGAHLVKHGGHEQAAGCDVEASQVDALREAVCACARQKLGDGDHPAREVRIDHAVPFAQVTVALMKEIERLQPFGERNEKPMLMSSDLRLAEPPRVIGADKTHLMLQLRSGDHVLKAMAFGQARRAGELSMGMPFDAVFTPKWNTFRGETNLELELHDFRPNSSTRG